jgi:hypothetical protein
MYSNCYIFVHVVSAAADIIRTKIHTVPPDDGKNSAQNM